MSGQYPPQPGQSGGGWPHQPQEPPTVAPGMPPSAPPPGGMPPTGPPPGGMPPTGPPPGGMPPGGMMPPGGPPPRKRKVGVMITAIAAVLVLVIGISVTSFLYFTGRMGFGPLSAEDKAAVSAIADGIEAPEWADEDQIECAAEDLVSDKRSKDLAKTGLIDADGDDWTYQPAEWDEDDATAFYGHALDCEDKWADNVADTWSLEDSGCLSDIDTDTMAEYFAADTLLGRDDEGQPDPEAESDIAELKESAVSELDDCYVDDPPEPKANAKPGYRSVKFTIDKPEGVTAEVKADGSWENLGGSSYSLDTGEGGVRGCVDVRLSVQYAWGSTSEASDEFCGKAKPKRLFWKKLNGCKSDTQSSCISFRLKYAGFADFDSLDITYTHNGGSCLADDGDCDVSTFAAPGGRGDLNLWSFPVGYSGNFVATTDDGMKARLPN